MATNRTFPDATAGRVDVCELFCGECGYGIVVRRDPPKCPMCRACEWRERPGVARWN